MRYAEIPASDCATSGSYQFPCGRYSGRTIVTTNRISEEVLYATSDPFTLGPSDIDRLKSLAEETDRQRIRICTHKDADDGLHEMFIVHPRGAYVRPHRHLGKIEAFYMVEGALDMVVFNDDGDITSVTEMGAYGSGLPFYHRMDGPLFHTMLIKSDQVVFHEVTSGPFVPSDTEFPGWAPAESDRRDVVAFLDGLNSAIDQFTVQSER
jgi:cupin fold WbuC family metalloprotein